MKEIIDRLFREFEFDLKSQTDDLKFYSRKDESFHEYYICDFIKSQILPEYLKERAESTIYPQFTKWQEPASDIEKNTSLIVFCGFEEDLPSDISTRNQILRIEEDGFFLKKYVVSFSQGAIARLQSTKSVKDFVAEIINNEESFDVFRSNAVKDAEYFVAMALQTKLPFFTISDNSGDDIPDLASYLINELGSHGLEPADLDIHLDERISSFVSEGHIRQDSLQNLRQEILQVEASPLVEQLLRLTDDQD